MIWLTSSTVARLRDQLQRRGQAASLVTPDPGMSAAEIEEMTILAEYGPLCEAMYLMMSADGRVGQDEREVLKGALRSLSADTIRGTHLEAMLDQAAKNVVHYGRAARLRDVAVELRDDRPRAEVAFVLAAAIAFADNAIADEENETLNELADGLGIDEARANTLLDDVESDLARQRGE